MKIVLKKKRDETDRDALLIQYVVTKKSGKTIKRTRAVSIGEELELPDDIAHEVLGKYRGLFGIVGDVNLSDKVKGYAHKGKKPKKNKVVEADGIEDEDDEDEDEDADEKPALEEAEIIPPAHGG